MLPFKHQPWFDAAAVVQNAFGFVLIYNIVFYIKAAVYSEKKQSNDDFNRMCLSSHFFLQFCSQSMFVHLNLCQRKRYVIAPLNKPRSTPKIRLLICAHVISEKRQMKTFRPF